VLPDYRQAERAKLEERLTVAEAHIANAQNHLIRQREFAKDLESKGFSQSAALARQLLSLFEEVMALHLAGRDKLASSLAELRQAAPDRKGGWPSELGFLG
jgi:hypothetical protein